MLTSLLTKGVSKPIDTAINSKILYVAKHTENNQLLIVVNAFIENRSEICAIPLELFQSQKDISNLNLTELNKSYVPGTKLNSYMHYKGLGPYNTLHTAKYIHNIDYKFDDLDMLMMYNLQAENDKPNQNKIIYGRPFKMFFDRDIDCVGTRFTLCTDDHKTGGIKCKNS